MTHPFVVPAQAGTQWRSANLRGISSRHWIPASAGMTHPLAKAAALRAPALGGCVS
jgi:hypothetical protein